MPLSTLLRGGRLCTRLTDNPSVRRLSRYAANCNATGLGLADSLAYWQRGGFHMLRFKILTFPAPYSSRVNVQASRQTDAIGAGNKARVIPRHRRECVCGSESVHPPRSCRAASEVYERLLEAHGTCAADCRRPCQGSSPGWVAK